MRWAHFYRTRIEHARGADAAARILENAQRIENMIHWKNSRAYSSHFTELTAIAIQNAQAERMARVFPFLPDDALLDMRAKCRQYLSAEAAAATEQSFLLIAGHDALIFLKISENLLAELPYVSNTILERKSLRINTPLENFFAAWIQYERLVYLRNIRMHIDALKAPSPDGETRFAYLRELDNEFGKDEFRIRLPLARMLVFFYTGIYMQSIGSCEYQALLDAAIAVELHRRKYGALPESLDALVPEFLDAVPVSVYDDAPFTYSHGLVEEAQGMFRRDSERLTYAFNGFHISGSIYERRIGGIKMTQCFVSVPLETGAPLENGE